MEDKREIVGVPQEKHQPIRGYLSELAEKTRQVYEQVSIPREEVDSRVVELEEKLHRKNQERARGYGLEYSRPQVLYLDRFAFFGAAEELEAVIKEKNMEKVLGGASSASGILFKLPNTVVVFGKSFQDKETDAFWTSFLLRHEMAHAGSVRKIQAREPEPNSVVIDPYRTGAIVFSRKKGTIGEAITEGHNSIEDTLMTGELEEKFDTWAADRHLSKEEVFGKRFPGGVKNYYQISERLKQQGKLPEGKLLTGYWKRETSLLKGEETYSHADDYQGHRELMVEIYNRDPELYRMVEDLIYGDRFLPFARRVNRVFGKGFFSRLMKIGSQEEAKEILEEIRSS